MFSHHEHVPAVSKACQPELHHLQLALPLLSPKFKNVVPCSHRDIVASYSSNNDCQKHMKFLKSKAKS